ncbi:MAG: polysaccharide biosynthesis tyrosine autokinase, partial [Victivallales bacterium]|nr:polysaccharide biosynthesis tyrosine autokinase [Victivallales bacterium]
KLLLKYLPLHIILLTVGAFSAFFISKYYLKPIYQAEVTMLIYVASGENSNNQAQPVDPYREIILGGILANDYKELVKSRRVAATVAEKLRRQYQMSVQPEYEIEVELKRQTRVVSLLVSGSDPKTVQIIANTTAEVFQQTISQIMKINNIQTIDPACLPKTPVKPNKARNTVFGAVLGLLLSLLFAFLREFYDKTLKSPEEAQIGLRKPNLGTIPLMEQENDAANNRLGVVSLSGNRSHAAEAFRIVRTNLQYALPDNKQGKIFTVTSTMPGEGKSFVVSNAAAVMAESGKKVLLIDCDLRKSSLHKIFSAANSFGLTNYLTGNAKLNEIIKHKAMDIPLDLILCGPIPPNPSELLMSNLFAEMLDKFRQEYDYIFIDAPPCINMTDAALLGKMSDGIVFIIAANKTRSDFIKRAIEHMDLININIIGFILNRFSPAQSGYGYYRYYKYYRYNSGYKYYVHTEENSAPGND